MHRQWLLGLMLVIVPTLFIVWAPPSAGDMPDEFQNLQLLDPEISKDDLKTIMKGFTKQLDVKCDFCHIIDEYHKDDNKHKRIARDMIRLVGYLRQNRDAYFPQEEEEEKEEEMVEEPEAEVLTCWLCHRGSAEVEVFMPDGDDD